MTELVLSAATQRALVIGLERIGWRIHSAEIDVARGTARIDLQRGNLLVTFDARNGRASTTREIIGRKTVRIGRRGRGGWTLVDRIDMQFVGRTWHEGARSGLRWLCKYIANNASQPTLPTAVRGLIAMAMDAPFTLADGSAR